MTATAGSGMSGVTVPTMMQSSVGRVDLGRLARALARLGARSLRRRGPPRGCAARRCRCARRSTRRRSSTILARSSLVTHPCPASALPGAVRCVLVTWFASILPWRLHSFCRPTARALPGDRRLHRLEQRRRSPKPAATRMPFLMALARRPRRAQSTAMPSTPTQRRAAVLVVVERRA